MRRRMTQAAWCAVVCASVAACGGGTEPDPPGSGGSGGSGAGGVGGGAPDGGAAGADASMAGGAGGTAGSVSPGGAAGTAGSSADDWPLPRPGSPGAGPACPEPDHRAVGTDWPEAFVGVEGCDDTGAGSRDQPFCSFDRALEALDRAPAVLTLKEGVYRQGMTVNRRGTAEAYFVIRAEEGARPVVLGSAAIRGADFEPAQAGLWRADVSGLANDPTGFWTSAGQRVLHEMETRDGVRSHAPASELVDAGTWTKADADGNACDGDNAGCYLYLRPPSGLDVPSTDFEASQHGFVYANGSDYLWIEGVETRFTQSSAIFTENASNVVIQDSTFAHNANGNDNSYNLRLWGADGAIVRRNRVSDSRYWGGAVNSHGITFMVTGEDADIWVCENEVFDGVGTAVSTKNGSSHIHVVGNYIHDIADGVHTADHRCDWRGCDERDFGGGAYDIRENLFLRCDTGVQISDRALERAEAERNVWPSKIYNNAFVDTARGVVVPRLGTQPWLRNNLFLRGKSGIYFQAGGTTTWPDYYFAQGFDSGFNFFAGEHAIYVYANWSGTERAMSLSEYRSEYSGEAGSLSGDPGVEADYSPSDASPLLGAGDATAYPGQQRVNIGLFPLAN
ncbi:MAG: right-handed parallel beta-helix repeat-containing protein [Polyangiaceae bacterium]